MVLDGGYQGNTSDGSTFGSGGVAAVGGAPSNSMYFLNTDYLKLVIHENKAFISRVYAPIPQQEVYIGKILVGLDQITTNRRMHAVIKTINPTL